MVPGLRGERRSHPGKDAFGHPRHRRDVKPVGVVSASVLEALSTLAFPLWTVECHVSKKSGAIAALVEKYRGQDLDARYLGYFDCFNRQLFFEAHEVLEELWLADRRGADGAFYKGLIQLAGAFVHLQKHRPQPAVALFKLARTNLSLYPATHQHLDVARVQALINDWSAQAEQQEGGVRHPNPEAAPAIPLPAPGHRQL